MIKNPWAYSDGCVVIDDLVCLSANNGIQLWEWTDFTRLAEIERWPEIANIIALHHEVDPERLQSAIQKAIDYSGHHLLSEGLCAGRWPRGESGAINFEVFIENLKFIEQAAATKSAKKRHTKIRRTKFEAFRSQIVLEMIEHGVPYVCAVTGCPEKTDLTIDHIKPLSRGGSDDIENLQFMCSTHNSKKGSRIK